jgi:hypothetical protein
MNFSRMNRHFESLYHWLSPVCLCLVAGMVYAGSGPLEPILVGAVAALFWAICGAFAATAVIAAILAWLAAKKHLRVAHARILRHRRQTSQALAAFSRRGRE